MRRPKRIAEVRKSYAQQANPLCNNSRNPGCCTKAMKINIILNLTWWDRRGNKIMSETKNTRMCEPSSPDQLRVSILGNIKKLPESNKGSAHGSIGHSFQSSDHFVSLPWAYDDSTFSLSSNHRQYLTTPYQGFTSYQLKPTRFLGLSFWRVKVQVVKQRGLSLWKTHDMHRSYTAKEQTNLGVIILGKQQQQQEQIQEQEQCKKSSQMSHQGP